MNNEWKAYWNNFAQAFAHPLKNNGLLGSFVSNPTITGAYAEAWIKSMAKTMSPRFRVSTGAIIRASDQTRGLKSIPQCDLIIWDPSEMPALFEQGDFALVSNFSVRAIIEIKRSSSDIQALREQLKIRQKCLLTQFRRNVLGVVISHSTPIFDGEVEPNWLKQEKWRRELPVTRLLDSKSQDADVDGIFAFIYFLAQLSGHGVDYGKLTKENT